MTEPARLQLAEPIMAVFRPTSGDVVLFVPGPKGTASCAIALDEAQRLHAALGQALALAANPGRLIENEISGGTFPPGTAAEGGGASYAASPPVVRGGGQQPTPPQDLSSASWESR